MGPDCLSALTPEKRNQVYRVLRLRVSAKTDGPLEAIGVIFHAPNMCSEERTYLCDPKPTHASELRFRALLHEETSDVELALT